MQIQSNNTEIQHQSHYSPASVQTGLTECRVQSTELLLSCSQHDKHIQLGNYLLHEHKDVF